MICLKVVDEIPVGCTCKSCSALLLAFYRSGVDANSDWTSLYMRVSWPERPWWRLTLLIWINFDLDIIDSCRVQSGLFCVHFGLLFLDLALIIGKSILITRMLSSFKSCCLSRFNWLLLSQRILAIMLRGGFLCRIIWGIYHRRRIRRFSPSSLLGILEAHWCSFDFLTHQSPKWIISPGCATFELDYKLKKRIYLLLKLLVDVI